MENNQNHENIEVPSLDTIQELPTVELPKLEDVPTAAEAPQPVPQPTPVAATTVQQFPQAPAAQQMPYMPQTMPQSYGYAPAATPSYAPVMVAKRSGGQIAALVFGIILTVLNGLLELLLFIGDAATDFKDSEAIAPAYVFFAFFLIIGIVLIIVGARKGKKLVPVGQQLQNTVYTSQPVLSPTYSTPVQPVATPVQPVATPVQPVATPVQPVATPVQPVATPVQPVATPVQPVATPVQPVAESVSTAADQPAATPVSTAASFNYAPTTIVTDDLKSVGIRSARKSAFISIGVVILMWVLLFALAFLFEKWVFSWYFLIIPIFISIAAIKSYPKSISAWVSLLFAILSIVAFIWMTIQLQVHF